MLISQNGFTHSYLSYCISCFLFTESNSEAPFLLVTSADANCSYETGKVDVIDSVDHPVITVESHNNVS